LQPSRTAMRHLIKSAFHAFGGPAVYRYLNRNGVRILMYHRFPSADTRDFPEHCEYLRRHYHPVSLQQVADSYRDGTPLPRHAVAITVDDGYRDFLERGHPVFRAHDIPTTVFLVSGFIDGAVWLWTDVLNYLAAHSPRESVAFAATGIEPPQRLSLRTPDERRAAARRIADRLKTMNDDARVRVLQMLPDAFAVELPDAPPREHAPLTWDEVRALADDGVEFGAHTRTHPILSKVTSAALEDEIVTSKRRIEEATGRRVIHFCYPNGRREDFTEETIAMLERAGFETAVTTEPGINERGAPRFVLRRLGVEPTNPMPYFQELLAGARAE